MKKCYRLLSEIKYMVNVKNRKVSDTEDLQAQVPQRYL
jgi:hypothetical protein